MKDLDLGMEYVIPSPGYRNVREQRDQDEKKEPEDFMYQKAKRHHVDCQDALETAARVEGLPLDISMHSHLRILDEDHHKGKYHHGLNLLKPIRMTSKHQHPVDNAGLFSFMTFSWLTPLARTAYRKGELFLEDIWPLSEHESSDINSRRLEKLWLEEVSERGAEEASLRSVVWKFCRTRLIVSIVCLMLTQLAGFIGPAFVVKRLLEYTQQNDPDLTYSLLLMFGLLMTEMVRSWSLALTWAMNYRTGSRLRGAILTMTFKKILKLKNIKEKTMGELINVCSSDGQRMFEAAAVGSLLAGGPIVAILGMIYNVFILGPTGFLGSAIFILFYPAMMFVSRLTAYFRRKCVSITDERVQKMNEVLNYIKFIKMYAWVKAFSQNVQKIRESERKILERAGYFQSITVGIAPIVVVIASVVTFSVHMLLGYDLSAAQAFTVVTVFNSMTFALKVTPFSVKSLSEASVSMERFKLTGLFQFTVRLASETEARFTSVERISHYIKTLALEAPARIKNKAPPADWPQEGEITFENAEMRYRENLPLVLKKVSFTIKPKEKIGIVGRTGSGKSSLGMALFRLVEISGGCIKIDGVKISDIGLADLRSKLAIIPQEPVLFSGTVQSNLDPFNQYTEEQIWDSLERTHMKECIAQLPLKLETEVQENGENFSVGERQLLCIARALLRRCKILILDEATAAMDSETDLLIQETIREAFADCTMLTIAHRLHTVLGSDRIMVLTQGQVTEFDTPSVLLSNENTRFYSMFAAAENKTTVKG
ncbi:ATP-binding cassette sub-family C member 5 isoform X2 [Ascaphus truei]|uniref:ATP-binding cassette sub-family C member 5 isoform X2 n=1 Tax=Ascaphus truei TaxID=8439 RepID=UPI003F59741A